MISKVALVLSGNIETAPYYVYYTDILDKFGVKYDIICWDRLLLNTNQKYCFRYKSPMHSNLIKKIFDFKIYSRYVKGILSSSGYDLVFVFTVMNSVFLASYLIKNFRGRYIIDIRDYSSFYPYTKNALRRVLENSKSNFVSSNGWKNWLPLNLEYTISHNVRLKDLQDINYPVDVFKVKPITITTFGTLRDYEIQKKLICELKNKDNINLAFIGGGYEPLKQYSEDNNITNIRFSGRYRKEEEPSIVINTDFVNILLPRSPGHDGAMSNRFYQAIIYRKPVIVNEGNIQADYVSRYSLGIVIGMNSDIYKEIVKYVSNFRMDHFQQGCLEIINLIKKEIIQFEESVKSTIEK